MCRNIKTLFNFDPPATDQEIHEAALQFVRKLSGFRQPSRSNEKVFNDAVEKVSRDAKILLTSLTTEANPHDREVEAAKAKARSLKRFGVK
jgi:hypothetical protein